MPIVATITTADGIVLSLDKFLTPDGRVPDTQMMEEEPLTSPGADGVRYRDVGLQFPVFTVDTIETQSTYTAAVTRCRLWDAMKTTNVGLVITNLGGVVSYRYARVHVSTVRARAVPGSVAGSAAGTTHAAHIAAQLEMQVMTVVPGVNP